MAAVGMSSPSAPVRFLSSVPSPPGCERSSTWAPFVACTPQNTGSDTHTAPVLTLNASVSAAHSPPRVSGLNHQDLESSGRSRRSSNHTESKSTNYRPQATIEEVVDVDDAVTSRRAARKRRESGENKCVSNNSPILSRSSRSLGNIAEEEVASHAGPPPYSVHSSSVHGCHTHNNSQSSESKLLKTAGLRHSHSSSRAPPSAASMLYDESGRNSVERAKHRSDNPLVVAAHSAKKKHKNAGESSVSSNSRLYSHSCKRRDGEAAASNADTLARPSRKASAHGSRAHTESKEYDSRTTTGSRHTHSSSHSLGPNSPILKEYDEPDQDFIEQAKHHDYKRRTSRLDSTSSMDKTVKKSSGSKDIKPSIPKGSSLRNLVVPGLHEEPEAHAHSPRCQVDKKRRETSEIALVHPERTPVRILVRGFVVAHAKLGQQAIVLLVLPQNYFESALYLTVVSCMLVLVCAIQALALVHLERRFVRILAHAGETSAESCPARNDARLTDQEHHCHFLKHRAASRSCETSSIIKEKSKSDAPCFTTDASVTALSMDEAEKASISALENAHAAVDAARLRRVALEKRKRDIEIQFAAIQEQAWVALADLKSMCSQQPSVEKCKQTPQFLPTHAKGPAPVETGKADAKKLKAHMLEESPSTYTEYDRVCQSSAENLQRDLVPHQVTPSRAPTTADRAECQNLRSAAVTAQVLKLRDAVSQNLFIDDELHNIHGCSGRKLDAVRPQDGGGSSIRSFSFHCDSSNCRVRSADGGEMVFASFSSESVGNIFGFDGANLRRQSNDPHPESVASARKCGAMDSRKIHKTVSSETGVNRPSTAVVSVTLKTLPGGATYGDPEARSGEIIAQSYGLCGGDIPSTENIGPKIGLSNSIASSPSIPPIPNRLASPASSSSSNPRSTAIQASSVSLSSRTQIACTFPSFPSMSPRSSALLAVPHAPPVSPPALSSCFQNTTDTEHVHNASAQPQHASLDPVIDSRRADSAYASAPATSISTVRRANSALISVAVAVALTPSYPVLPEAHGSPSKLPSRARDVPKPLTELHAPSRSASPQAARRDYSERAFSVAAVAPTSSTSLSASSAPPMLASKSTCTLLPQHLTAPEMGSVRSASFAADLHPLHPASAF
ncbi:hypothetical protein K438DRAFT_1963131 [Mycena galopus ATCC 62051]|nr:hypothetical protein K438DRAFT_1963131 [Mycena galopus ATCC 62051]